MTAIPPAEHITGKGSTYKAAMAFVEERFGENGLSRLDAALAPNVKEAFSGLILPSARYPLSNLVAVYEAIDRVFGRGDLAMCADIGKAAADYEVKFFHKMFLKIAKIEYWFKIAAVSWKSYYSTGRLVADLGKDGGILTLTEFNPVSKAFCLRFGGWSHRVCELSGLKSVRIDHEKCVLDGDDACVWKGVWT